MKCSHGWTIKNLRIKAALVCLLLAATCLTGCSNRAALVSRDKGQTKFYTREQIMVVAATERNRYQNIFTGQVWSVAVDKTGTTFEKSQLDQIRQFLQEMAVMNLLADEREIALSGQDLETIRRLSQEYYTGLSDGDKAYIGIDLAGVEDLYTKYCRANRLVTELTKDMDLEVSDAEAKVIEVCQIALDSEESALQVMALVQAEGADFTSIAKQYSKDPEIEKKLVWGIDRYGYEQAAFSLEQDQISSVLPVGEQYYILKCVNAYDQEATFVRKQELAAARKNQAFHKIYDPFRDQHKVDLDGSVWNGISFAGGEDSSTVNFFELYHQYFPE